MVFEIVSTVIEVFGFIVLIYTIYLTLRELKDVRAQTQYQARNLDAELMKVLYGGWLKIDALFIDYPELSPYFYEGKELLPEEPLSPTIRNMAYFILDTIEMTSHQYSLFSKGFISRGHQINYCRSLFKLSPLLCNVFDEVSEWYSDDVRKWRIEGEALRTTTQKE